MTRWRWSTSTASSSSRTPAWTPSRSRWERPGDARDRRARRRPRRSRAAAGLPGRGPAVAGWPGGHLRRDQPGAGLPGRGQGGAPGPAGYRATPRRPPHRGSPAHDALAPAPGARLRAGHRAGAGPGPRDAARSDGVGARRRPPARGRRHDPARPAARVSARLPAPAGLGAPGRQAGQRRRAGGPRRPHRPGAGHPPGPDRAWPGHRRVRRPRAGRGRDRRTGHRRVGTGRDAVRVRDRNGAGPRAGRVPGADAATAAAGRLPAGGPGCETGHGRAPRPPRRAPGRAGHPLAVAAATSRTMTATTATPITSRRKPVVMIPRTRPTWASLRPPSAPPLASISRTTRLPSTHATGPTTPPPASDRMPRPSTVVAWGWAGRIGIGGGGPYGRYGGCWAMSDILPPRVAS